MAFEYSRKVLYFLLLARQRSRVKSRVTKGAGQELRFAAAGYGLHQSLDEGWALCPQAPRRSDRCWGAVLVRATGRQSRAEVARANPSSDCGFRSTASRPLAPQPGEPLGEDRDSERTGQRVEGEEDCTTACTARALRCSAIMDLL